MGPMVAAAANVRDPPTEQAQGEMQQMQQEPHHRGCQGWGCCGEVILGSISKEVRLPSCPKSTSSSRSKNHGRALTEFSH